MKVDTRVDNKKYGLADESKVWCAVHPVLRHKLTKLRDERTDSRVFRHLLREVTFYLGYDATDDLETVPKKIKTPKGDHQGAELSTSVALVPILRAGLGMVEPMLDVLPNATVHHIGMYRNKQSLLPVQYYNKLPKECNADVAIILEPVIATAGTILATLAVLKTWGVEKIKIVSAIASKQGLQEVCAKNPDVEIFLAAIDDGLSEDGYILPGLGDAGDREFQTGAQLEKVENAHKKRKM
ncbi:uracil phosphoribosyltransferase [Phytophthora cinnamomi]|uniref:uracil phosphoribosyltransferase n=1 Tax=Phytophthora cinnamomi TaxID=4785 RepID=UPI003559D0D8|nr:uracil phosphoribosyltransferase [Phytophthora cinnamomi]